jgi:hypothetical protein
VVNNRSEVFKNKKTQYYGKLLFYIFILGFGFANIVKLVGFLLYSTRQNSTVYLAQQYLNNIQIAELFLNTIFIPVTYYFTVRFLHHINKRNEI